MSIHDGHRERMRQRIKKEGMDSFQPHEVLEALLYYCIPRGNTNPIAHSLIKRYKTVAGVLAASPIELREFEGVGENVVFFLSMLNQVSRYLNLERSVSGSSTTMLDPARYRSYMTSLFDGLSAEVAYLLCLNSNGELIGHYKVGEGDTISTPIPIRKIIEVVMTSNATAIILAHNHPSGIVIPSDEDIAATQAMEKLLMELNIYLIDHLIICKDKFVSVVSAYRDIALYLLEIAEKTNKEPKK